MLGKRIPILLIAIWIALWILPWAAWLDPIPWLRLGVAMVIFTAPGMTFSLLLLRDQFDLPTHFVSGLSLSTLAVSSLGLFGRVLNLPFAFIEPSVFTIGLIALIILTLRTSPDQRLYKPSNSSYPSMVLLSIMLIAGSVMGTWYRFGGDSWSYLAYLTNWQQAEALNFRNVLFLPLFRDSIRFWFAMHPMVQALLADLSGLHGILLLGYYLGPVLVPIATLAAYCLYKELLRSDRQAVFAILIQLTFLYLLPDGFQPGASLFQRMPQDKAFAAFILAPVFFLGIRLILQNLTPRNLWFAFLAGASLTLTHPIILAYSVFIAGIYAAIITLTRRDFKTFSIILLILAVIIAPIAALRFVDDPEMGTNFAFDLDAALDLKRTEDRVSYIEGTPFYGFNLQIIEILTNTNTPSIWQTFFSQSYLWMLFASFIWSIFNFRKKNDLAPFITASALLVLLCAIPYTGWLVGYFVAARMLLRSTWLFPIGLAGMVLITELLGSIPTKSSTSERFVHTIQRSLQGFILLLCTILIVHFTTHHYAPRWQEFTKLSEYKTQLEEFTSLARHIDRNISEPSIFLASSIDLTNYLPGLSSKAKVVYFRHISFTPYSIDSKKAFKKDLKNVFSVSESVSLQKRLRILQKYEVQYVLLDRLSQVKYYNDYPDLFDIQPVGSFWIMTVRQ
ncbi:MAG: hypothetical protein HC801_11865 [Nitrospira sp.]|nr:hypothetical protein [Nitrospira sp.]